MSLILEKCRNGFLMIPAVGQPTFSDAYYLTDEQVPQQIKDAFKAEEDAQKLRAVRPELVSLSKEMGDFPVLNTEVTTSAHMAA